jgi:hypothetical protein
VSKITRGVSAYFFQHIPRAHNQEANRLAQSTSGYRVIQEILNGETLANDWRVEIADYLNNPQKTEV